MKVFVVTEQQTIDCEEYNNCWVFENEEKAQVHLNKRIELFKNNYNTEGYYEDKSPRCYECYEEGSYIENHFWIQINERVIL